MDNPFGTIEINKKRSFREKYEVRVISTKCTRI